MTQAPEHDRAQWLGSLVDRHHEEVLDAWARARGGGPLGPGGGIPGRGTDSSGDVLEALHTGLRGGSLDPTRGEGYAPLRRLLTDLSVSSARSGSTPSETANGVLALGVALLTVSEREPDAGPDPLAAALSVNSLVNALAVHTFEVYVKGREDVIGRQSAQLMELSTPVVRLWDGVVGVPLVGTLDSSRAQVVMETLLQAIVDEHASVAILDITGVPTVDTLVAQHLLKTVTATRLMGADCIISGIRPSTAQTIVQLGIDLADITTRATLADALSTAIARVAALTPAVARPPT